MKYVVFCRMTQLSTCSYCYLPHVHTVVKKKSNMFQYTIQPDASCTTSAPDTLNTLNIYDQYHRYCT